MRVVKAPKPWGKKTHFLHKNGRETLCRKPFLPANGWEEVEGEVTCQVCRAILSGKGAVLNDSQKETYFSKR